MTFIHFLLLILVSAGISGFNIYYLRSGIKSPSLFYFCSIYLLFIVTLPFASDLYSYFFNEILDLPDARISILALFSFRLDNFCCICNLKLLFLLIPGLVFQKLMFREGWRNTPPLKNLKWLPRLEI